MRGRRLVALVLGLLLVPTLNGSPAQARPADPPWDTAPARAVLERLLPARHAAQLELAALPAQPVEEFRIGRRHAKVLVSGTGPSALLAGVNAYLERVAGVDISWNGDSLDRLGDRLPLPETEIRQPATVANRFALNDTDDGYTGAYRTWDDWEHELDVLALHGIHQAFLPVGAEAVYLETFRQFGYSEEELLRWIPQPSHQPWWLLQNMSGFPSAPTRRLIDERAELGRRIADRMRELGITPVLPGYFGTVPPGFDTLVAGARIVPQGNWVGFTRPDWLDPTDPAFARVAAAFYASSARIFGPSTHYKMDLLHEGGRPGPVDVGAASRAVQDALETARPNATWVFLGWQNNPRPDTLAAIDRSRVLIVDGLSDRYAGTERNKTWPDTTYAFGSIWNFGGHTTIGANTRVWEDRFWRWRAEPGSTLDGIAVMPEASDNNPAAFDYLAGLAWRSGPVDPASWFADWAKRRYGGADAAATSTWQTIGKTAYAMPADGSTEAQDGLFAAAPSLTRTSAATWSPDRMRYSAAEFAQALPALLEVAPELRHSSAYKYDLMDVTRQVLSNRSRILLPQLKAAYDSRNRAEFDRLAALWLSCLELLEEVTATNRQTMLGPWLRDARSWGAGTAEADALEHSARTLLTVWGTRSGYDQGLGDYANREWSGLISTYYAPRWKTYLDELSESLRENRAPRQFDWYQNGADWAASASASSEKLPMAPSGDIHRIAGKVLGFLQAHPDPIAVSASVQPAVLPDNGTATVKVRLTNADVYRTARGIEAALTAEPGSGLTVRQAVATVPDLPPGGSAEAQFTVDATGPSEAFHARLTASVSADTGASASAVRVLRTAPVQPPYRTRTNNAAQFAQRGERFLIEGAGNDLWGGTNHFGAIYRDKVLTPGTTVTTRVVSQDRTGPWARAGLITGTALAGDQSRGFANIAVSPDNGCLFSYDTNGDGRLDSYAQVRGVTTPLWVRLTREADVVTGYCSTDGTTWTKAGAVAVPPGADLDAGLFMSAANGGSGARGAVEFDGYRVG